MATEATLVITTPGNQLPATSLLTLDRRLYLMEAVNVLTALASGAIRGTIAFGGGTAATGTLTISGGVNGSVDGIINGVTITASAAGNDGNTAANLAAAINASNNALVKGFVTATSRVIAGNNWGVVDITAVVKGKIGNAITLAGALAAASGARLTGGADASATTVSI